MTRRTSERAESLKRAHANLAERLRVRQPEIEAAIFARIRAVSDSDGTDDTEYLAGLLVSVSAMVDYNVALMEHEEEPSAPIPVAVITQARRAARYGVSLGTVMLRNSAARRVMVEFVMDEADRSGLSSNGSALRHLFNTQELLWECLAAAIVREYTQAVERLGRSTGQRRRELVQRLLGGEPANSAELDYEFDAWHLGVIAMGGRATETLQRLAEGLGRRLLSVPRSDETVWAWFAGQQRLAIADVESLLSARESAGLWFAIGEPGRGIDGWRRTHRQAQAAMVVALRRPQRLTRYADVALLAAVLRDEELVRSLVEIYLSPLDGEKNRGAVARETLRAYFAAGHNVATAAAARKVDRHTVQRRVHAIEQALGRPLHTCQAELEVALRVEELGESVRLPDNG